VDVTTADAVRDVSSAASQRGTAAAAVAPTTALSNLEIGSGSAVTTELHAHERNSVSDEPERSILPTSTSE
jgi:hypothetical protein